MGPVLESSTGAFGALEKLDVEPTIDMKTQHATIGELSMSRQAILLEISRAAFIIRIV